jgi:hypothetical protein
MVMKTKLLITFLFILLLTGTLFALDRNRKIAPVKGNVHAVLTKSLYNQTLTMDARAKRLVYISYIAGFVDAMEMNSINNQVAKKFIQDCSGLTLGNLIDLMTDPKDDGCQWRNVSPAVALTVVIPRLRKGLSPLPEEE